MRERDRERSGQCLNKEGGNGGEDKKWKDEKICTPTKKPTLLLLQCTHTLSARQKWGHPPTLSHRQKSIILLLRTVGNDGRQAAQTPRFLRCMCMSPGKRLRGHVRMIHGGWEMEEGWALSPICNVQVHVQHRSLYW